MEFAERIAVSTKRGVIRSEICRSSNPVGGYARSATNAGSERREGLGELSVVDGNHS